MSNRFKNLVFDNKSNNKKENTKLKENSRWKREEGDANRFKSSNRGSNKEGNKGNYRGGGARGNYRGGNRNNFNRKYKGGNYQKPTGPAPCAADKFGINFKNLEKFDKNQEKTIEKKKEQVVKPKFMKMEKKMRVQQKKR